MKNFMLSLIIIFAALGLNACASGPDTSAANLENAQSCSADLGADSGADSEQGWNKANLTYYTSYPEKGSEECTKYNGCKWAGRFSAVSGRKSREWVASRNIIAVHSKDYEELKLKRILLRKGNKSIIATVYDQCADSDCKGCCTRNLRYGHLIDIEENTMKRFGPHSGIVEWKVCD